jgi:hypothetical protein
MTKYAGSMLVILFSLICVQPTMAQRAAARTYFACVNSDLYVCVGIGSEVGCFHTTTSCAGHWLVSVGRKANIPDNPGVVHTLGVSDREAAEVLRIATELRQSDFHSYYRASDAMQSSLWRRAGLSSKGAIDISERKLAPWLLEGMSSGNFFPDTVERGSCPGDLYPNPKPGGGRNCYPCLGCTPCGNSYCSIYRIRLTTADLSPKLAQQGYTVKDGRLRPPTRAVDR